MEGRHGVLDQPGVGSALIAPLGQGVLEVEVDPVQLVEPGVVDLLPDPQLPVGGVEELVLGVVGDEGDCGVVAVGQEDEGGVEPAGQADRRQAGPGKLLPY